ncbi:MAG: hypothetical protein HYZ23_05190 [Chloroflexi bacterium]|nr:hypothetical protein [Chloroflexota bacterium]
MNATKKSPIFTFMQASTSERYEKSDFILAGFVSLLHLSAAILSARLLGVSINIAAPWGEWDWFWQTLPLDLLRTDLWGSIWYLHSQPPLFNVLGGVLAKLFYPYHLEALHILNVLLGSLLCGLAYLLAAHFAPSRRIAAIWGLIISLNPALFLYEAYILYSLPTAFLIVAQASCILWHQRAKSAAALYCFIGALNLLILTRSAYHIILVPVALAFVFLISEKGTRAKVVLICAILCLSSVSWYAKNLAVFGFFGSSSWSGQSLRRIASDGYTKKELKELSSDGVIDALVAEKMEFLLPSAYEEFGFQKRSPIAALSNDDHNNVNIPDISAAYGRNAARLIEYRPQAYARTVWKAFSVYCKPSSRYSHLAINFNKMFGPVKRYITILQFVTTSFLIVFLPAVLILYVIQTFARYRWNLSQAMQTDSVLFWCFFMILYSVVLTCITEIGENNRFKFEVETLIWILAPVALGRVKPLIRIWESLRGNSVSSR